MEETEKLGCTGHCESCNMTQRVYCSAQIGLYNQKEIAIIKEIQERILEKVDSLVSTKNEELSTIHHVCEE